MGGDIQQFCFNSRTHVQRLYEIMYCFFCHLFVGTRQSLQSLMNYTRAPQNYISPRSR